MVIAEISTRTIASNFANVEPFIYEIRPGAVTYAGWWSDIFGLEDESSTDSIEINSFIRYYTTKYNSVDSYTDLQATEQGFYWDSPNQILYIHFEHDQEGDTDVYQYSSFLGFSDKKPVYLDDQQYAPLITGSPSFAQSIDIEEYDKMNFLSGNLTISNGEMKLAGQKTGISDIVVDTKLYGNDVFIYHLPDNAVDKYGNGSRSDLVALGAFYIEDYNPTLKEVDFSLQDLRKAGDIDVPTETLSIVDYPNIDSYDETVIPLMYGTVKEAPVIPLNSDTEVGEVDFIVAVEMTDLGIAYAYDDDTEEWIEVTPINIDLDNGKFSLSESEGRDGDGNIYDVKLVLPTGIAIEKTSDIIIDLNERFLGISFVDSYYDIEEWEDEASRLSNGGWFFDSIMTLYEAVLMVQNGSMLGFRYEVTPSGLRTLRIDDNNRQQSGFIDNNFYSNIDELPVETDSDLVYAYVKTLYDYSFYDDTYSTDKNSDYAEKVLQDFKNVATSTSENTMLTNSADAAVRSQYKAERFSDIPKILTLDLMGEEFLTLRILDVKRLAITPGVCNADLATIEGRQYYGYKNCKIISIDPDSVNKRNTIEFQILSDAVMGQLKNLQGYGFSEFGEGYYG